jgi:hypothetical protein
MHRSDIRRFDAFRKKRNVSDYERAGATSETEAAEMKALATDLLRRLDEWLKQHHAELA